MSERWIDLTGAVNVRDLGGLPATGGATTRFGQMLRSDNLQGLTDDDVSQLTTALNVRDVVDLRTTTEVVAEGPGPLLGHPAVTVHHLSLYPEIGSNTDVEAESVLPWNQESDEVTIWESAGLYYTNYLRHRPANVVAALRIMANAAGATVTHCAAGKDRTGVVCALALSVAGVERDAIVDDYVQSGERIEQVVARLKTTPTYAADLDSRPVDSNRPHAESMRTFLDRVDHEFGGPLRWLGVHGWTESDTEALRARLLDR
ncbi:protein tyrosine/serine phosphatase [Haloactinopolyspora alba]|uniref:Protein tyrosine/serine phosphatase n=1 Tax=Haloactinopolyspora alba TaxID=648780 RepID=A0A2P8DYW1_9ACTN|nr:tyrosine-protein phosphatase [Haloactinopolyspora alba]PSL02418.1 protein tyrosine/serine phosphatase [Haloactinopolyspora alba]